MLKKKSENQIFWVDSTGKIAAGSLKTLSEAIAKCKPEQGDQIFIAPGHYEEIDESNNISINVPGIKILGLGLNEDRPLFKTVVFNINAENVHIENLHFVSNKNACKTFLNIYENGASIQNCYFEIKENSWIKRLYDTIINKCRI